MIGLSQRQEDVLEELGAQHPLVLIDSVGPVGVGAVVFTPATPCTHCGGDGFHMRRCCEHCSSPNVFPVPWVHPMRKAHRCRDCWRLTPDGQLVERTVTCVPCRGRGGIAVSDPTAGTQPVRVLPNGDRTAADGYTILTEAEVH